MGIFLLVLYDEDSCAKLMVSCTMRRGHWSRTRDSSSAVQCSGGGVTHQCTHDDAHATLQSTVHLLLLLQNTRRVWVMTASAAAAAGLSADQHPSLPNSRANLLLYTAQNLPDCRCLCTSKLSDASAKFGAITNVGRRPWSHRSHTLQRS